MLEIREIDRKDYAKARQFAIIGMNFHWYIQDKWILDLYSRYFWNLSLIRATKVYGAYLDGKFAGCLIASMKGEEKPYWSFARYCFVKVFDWLQYALVGNKVGAYDLANEELLADYCAENNPDGEIIFFAVDPACKGKGIGSALLNKFSQDVKSKQIYLYTDSACTYQFYEHRNFEQAGKRDIILNLADKKIKLQCFLYSRRFV